MYRRKLSRLLATCVLCAAIALAAPALAARAPEVATTPQALDLLETWWTDLWSPVTSLFAPSDDDSGPTGDTTTTSTDGPTVDPHNGSHIDPDG